MKFLKIKFSPKIKVTPNGGFYIESKDIFSDTEKTRKQLDEMRKIVKKYKVSG